MAIIGIDLGTSNSAAVLRGGRPMIIPSAEGISLGGKAFPSYVALTADGQMLVDDATRYADADKKRREDAEKLNSADANCYEAEKMLVNFADKLTEDLKKRIETALRQTKEALLKKDVKLANERADALRKVLQEAGAVLYSQSGQAGKGGRYAETRWKGPDPTPNVGAATGEPRPSGSGPRGKVVDAEYKENTGS